MSELEIKEGGLPRAGANETNWQVKLQFGSKAKSSRKVYMQYNRTFFKNFNVFRKIVIKVYKKSKLKYII